MNLLTESAALKFYHTQTEERYSKGSNLISAMQRMQKRQPDRPALVWVDKTSGRLVTTKENILYFIKNKTDNRGKPTMTSRTVSPHFNQPVGKAAKVNKKKQKRLQLPEGKQMRTPSGKTYILLPSAQGDHD